MTKASIRVQLEETACPNNCVPGDLFVLQGRDRLHGIAGVYSVLQCASCGLMRTSPRPTPETIGEYYPSDYAPYQSKVYNKNLLHKNFWRLLLSKFQSESKSIPPIPAGHLLEIGCANGEYMEKMLNSGWSVEGIEFSESASLRARAKGFNVQASSVENAQDPTRPLDLIVAWMVLEHLHEPVKALRKMKSWVKSEGYLVASVPDASSLEFKLFGEFWYALQLPTHLFHYTPKSISTVLMSAGWELTRVSWQPNCINLLRSIEYWTVDKKFKSITSIVRWLRLSKHAYRFRLIAGWILGVTRQSGRMEIWARPIV